VSVTFALSYAQVARLLALIHDIDPEERGVAFRGRLQHFQRLKYPPGVNTGRGKPAAYSAGQVTQLAIALELTQLGISPERAVTILNNNAESLVTAIRAAVYWLNTDHGEGQGSMVLYLDPAALSSLAGASQRDLASITFTYASWKHLRARIDRWDEETPFKRLALINLSTLIYDDIINYLVAMEIGDSEAFRRALKLWTDAQLKEELPDHDRDPEA
jgi:hypothetical protein